MVISAIGIRDWPVARRGAFLSETSMIREMDTVATRYVVTSNR